MLSSSYWKTFICRCIQHMLSPRIVHEELKDWSYGYVKHRVRIIIIGLNLQLDLIYLSWKLESETRHFTQLSNGSSDRFLLTFKQKSSPLRLVSNTHGHNEWARLQVSGKNVGTSLVSSIYLSLLLAHVDLWGRMLLQHFKDSAASGDICGNGRKWDRWQVTLQGGSCGWKFCGLTSSDSHLVQFAKLSL